MADGYCKDNQVEAFNHTLPIVDEAKYPALKTLMLDGYQFGESWAEEPQEGPKVYGSNVGMYEVYRMSESVALVRNQR